MQSKIEIGMMAGIVMVDVIRNERVKLTAGILNTIAAAIVTVGVLTPFAVSLYMQLQPPPGSANLLTAMPYVCIGAAIFLHCTSLAVLRLMDVSP